MRENLESIKTLIIEIVGIIGGSIWSYQTHWDYEPLLVLITSCAGLVVSLLLIATKPNLFKNEEKQDTTKVIHLPNTLSSSKENIVHISPNKTPAFIDITPTEIKNKISNASLFQQPEIAKSFEGLNVKWILKLFMIHRRENNIISVSMKHGDYGYTRVNFFANIEIYPVFKIAEEGQAFIVSGQIIECELYDIKLELIELTIYSEAQT